MVLLTLEASHFKVNKQKSLNVLYLDVTPFIRPLLILLRFRGRRGCPNLEFGLWGATGLSLVLIKND